MFGKLHSLALIILLTQLVSVEIKAGVVVINNTTRPIQKQLTLKDAVYEIKTAIDLKGELLSIPQNSVLKFEGGSLKNGKLKYNNTFIEGRYNIQCTCEGGIANDIVDPQMYGARGDGKSDDSHAIQQAINSGKQVLFRRNSYLVEKPIVFDKQNFVVDFNLSTIKKISKTGFNYIYEDYNFNKIPCVILIKPYKSNTSGHIVIKNLIVDGGKNNIGIHAVWCRNVALENIRVYGATRGLVYKGFTNTFRDVTIWDSSEGFVILGGNATLFERCFSAQCGWDINKSRGLSLIGCSSDDFNPCYKITNSNVSMVGCTYESKGIGLIVDNSVVDMSGDFETHVYDSTKSLTYIKASNNSFVRANGCVFHLSNYLKKKVPDSNVFEVSGKSVIEINGKVTYGSSLRVKKENGTRIILNGKEQKNGLN